MKDQRRETVKSLVPMIAMVMLAMSVGCNSSVEKEALKRAKEHWKLTQLGGSYYLCEITAATRSSAYGAIASKTVFELRNSKLEVSPNSLSEADKLNGVEWGGVVYLKTDAFRRYSPEPYSGKPDKTWSDWVSRAEADRGLLSTGAKGYHDALGVRKIKGQWEVEWFPSLMASGLDPNMPGHVTFKQVESSDLPK